MSDFLKISKDELGLERRSSFNESNLRAILENTDASIWLVDDQYKVIEFNSTFAHLFELAYGVKLKRNMLKEDYLNDAALKKKWLSRYDKALSGQKGIYLDSYEIAGRERFYEITTFPIVEKDRITGVAVFSRDVTSQKVAEKKLGERNRKISEGQAKLSAMIENSTDMILSLDQDLRLITANSAYKKYLKDRYNVTLRKGRYVFQGAPKSKEEFWNPKYKEALQGKALRVIDKIKYKNKINYYEVSLAPIKESGKKIIGLLITVKDITDQKITEEKLIKKNKELTKLNEELDRFVYSTSHDLRAPLVSVKGLINVALKDERPDNIKEYLSMMNKSIAKLDHFIKDITNYSRNTRLELKREKIEFEKMLGEVFDELKFLDLKQETIPQIVVSGKASFSSDPNRLRIIFNNLVSNSIRYADPQKGENKIKIDILVSSKQASITVEDNGAGIEDSHLERIFDMFYRGSEKSSGSGLGLYIVKETVSKLEGSISVKSEPRKGTTFFIVLPNRS